MALMHGKGGNVQWDTSISRQTIAGIQSWTCDVSMDVVETTAMQATWKTYLGGFMDWTAEVTAYLPDDGTDISLAPGNPNGLADADAYLELYLKFDSTNTAWRMLFGQCICTGIGHTVDAQGVPMATYSFQGVDMLAWDSEDAAQHSYA